MLIFKELQNAVKEVTNNLTVYKKGDGLYENEIEKLSALREILEFVSGYTWLKREDAKKKLSMVLQSNYNYTKVAKELGISVASLQTSISLMSKTLTKKLGSNTIKLILRGDVSEALLQFRAIIGEFNFLSLLLVGFVDKLPESKDNVTISLADCTDEICLLRDYTHKGIEQKIIIDLDAEKLALLRYVLESNDTDYSYERRLIYQFIIGEITGVEDLKELLDVTKSIYA